jgi:CXXX repeat peptide maturase
VSYCHYENNRRERKLIPIEKLKQGIRFGMMENLMIQYVYPDYELPEEYAEVIESIDHSKIKPVADEADILVVSEPVANAVTVPVVWRLNKVQLFEAEKDICEMLTKTPRLNVVITDIDSFTDEDFERYKALLEKLSESVEQLYAEGKSPQLNLLTDRMMLKEMNNCGAGDTCITLAPNGRFYICPAFYFEDKEDFVGDLEHGLDIKNQQLYKLSYAPICRHCDAYQCKRCVWMNRKTTLEVNTPSHEQCVVAHLERNASRDLLNNIRKHSTFLPNQEEITEIDYLDPFDKRDEW